MKKAKRFKRKQSALSNEQIEWLGKGLSDQDRRRDRMKSLVDGKEYNSALEEAKKSLSESFR